MPKQRDHHCPIPWQGISLLVLLGCTGSRPIDVAAHPRLRPDAMVEFDVHDRRVQLDSVLFTADSVSGIPWHDARRCCARVAYALADISQPQLRTFSSLGTIFAGIGIVFALYIVALGIALHGYST